MFQQYYVVKNTYKLLLNHINNGNHYDLIIRLRFDQFIFSDEVHIPSQIYDTSYNAILYNQQNNDILKKWTEDKTFIFDEIEDNTLYVFGIGDFKHYKFANDQFFIIISL